LKNPESLMSLQRRGFFPNPNQKGGDTIEFYSKSGELIVTLKDGVQYLLRFGGPAGAEINAVDSADKKEGDKAEETVSINRFMLVTTRVDASKFPPPELERLPETVEELKEIERMKQKPANLPSSIEVPESPPTTSEPSSSPEKPAESETAEKPAQEKPSETNPSPDAPVPPVQEKPEAVSSAWNSAAQRMVAFQDPPTEAQKIDAPAKTDEPIANAELTEDEWKEKLDATRKKITKENQRKIDKQNEELMKTKNKVAELNGRFADWYYVVSESDYGKLKVTLAQLIERKTAGSSGTGGPPGGFSGGGAFPGFQP